MIIQQLVFRYNDSNKPLWHKGPAKSRLDPFSIAVNFATFCSEQVDEGIGECKKKGKVALFVRKTHPQFVTRPLSPRSLVPRRCPCPR